MTQDAHPTEEVLAAYAEAADPTDRADVTRHLAHCATCRTEVAAMRRVVDALCAGSPLGPAPAPGVSHLSEESVARYVDQRLEAPERAAAKTHLDACPTCLRAALHYAGHATAMRAALGTDAPAGDRRSDTETGVAPKPAARVAEDPPRSILDGIRRLFSARLPVGIAVPVTVAATATLALMVWPGRDAGLSPGGAVVSYQDTPVVTFVRPEGAPPGIGFFGQAGERTEPFEGLHGRMTKDGNLALSWPPVPGAARYTLTLYRVGAGDRREEVARVEATEPRARITAAIEPGRRYEWRLSGAARDGSTFSAAGGLAVASRDG